MVITNTKEKFILYIKNKIDIEISIKIVDDLLDSIKPEIYDVFIYYFVYDYSIVYISKITNRNIYYIQDVIDKIIYLTKILYIKPTNQNKNDYTILTGIGLLSDISKLNLKNGQLNTLYNNSIYTINDLVNFIENGNKLNSLKGITTYIEKRIINTISIFLSIETVLKVKYGIYGLSKALSILSNKEVLK